MDASRLDPLLWYGQPVRLARLHEIVTAEVERRLSSHGFVPAGVLKWVRDDDAPIRQVFGLTSGRGVAVKPRWGVSLDFVPHLSGDEVRWHRTNKAAVFDLYRDAGWAFRLDTTRGEQHIKLQYIEVLEQTIPEALKFWSLCSSLGKLPDFLDHGHADAVRAALGRYRARQSLAVLFIWAKSGRLDEASSRLGNICAEYDPPKLRVRLERLLVEASHEPIANDSISTPIKLRLWSEIWHSIQRRMIL